MCVCVCVFVRASVHVCARACVCDLTGTVEFIRHVWAVKHHIIVTDKGGVQTGDTQRFKIHTQSAPNTHLLSTVPWGVKLLPLR